MNTTKAVCGHPTPAVGAPGSAARLTCESSLCWKCSQAIELHDRMCGHGVNLDDWPSWTDAEAAAIVFGRMAAYCDAMSRAMRHRTGGDVEAALASEKAAQHTYNLLPTWARW